MKKLSEVCRRLNIKATNVNNDFNIEGIEIDSNKIKQNYIFVVTDGNEIYVDEAFKRGAVCAISEKALNVPCIKVDNVRESLSLCCSDFYDNPEKNLKIIGVVGTNGKTSITHMLYEIVRPYKKVCVIGTLGIVIDGEKITNDMTTPDPPTLYKSLALAREANVEYVFCEVTAHAIFFKKFYGIRCEMCIFTNITQDHLDSFGTMEGYARVKMSYFIKENMKIGIINVDDKHGEEIAQNNNICSISYGINQPSDVFAINISNEHGLKFIVNAFDDIIYVNTRFEGKFNVYNILAAIAAARVMGIPPREIQSRLRMMAPIDGRADCIHQNPKIIIDFAHTPDGLENVLLSLKETTKGRLIAVFGCGGNRDKAKRPIMARIGTRIADVCIFTSDNPRTEQPDAIITDMINGVDGAENYISIPDRVGAIEFALRLAESDDCVAICGKGGECYMDVGGKKYPYSDKETCMSILEKLHCNK